MIKNSEQDLNIYFLNRLEELYSGRPWYGKNIMKLLFVEDIVLGEEASKILMHMISWMDYVSDVMQGQDRKIELNTKEDWPDVLVDQRELLTIFSNCYQRLSDNVKNFDKENWNANLPGSKYSFHQLCQGIIDHNLYHLGQIARLLSK